MGGTAANQPRGGHLEDDRDIVRYVSRIYPEVRV